LIARAGYWYATQFTDKGRRYAERLADLDGRRIAREDRWRQAAYAELVEQLRPQVRLLADKLREGVYQTGQRIKEKALADTDVGRLLFANTLLAESSNPNARNYDWIFEGQLEEAADRMYRDPTLTPARAFPGYTVENYLNSDVVKPDVVISSKEGRAALIEFQSRLKRHKALVEGEAKLLVSRDYPGWAYLKFGPLNEEQARWVAHVWGTRDIDGVLFQSESRCSQFACGALTEADRLTELTSIEKLRRDQERHLTKPQISERTGEVEFYDNVAGRFAYLTLGMMGYFKNETRRLVIPASIGASVNQMEIVAPAREPEEVLFIRDEADDIRFIE